MEIKQFKKLGYCLSFLLTAIALFVGSNSSRQVQAASLPASPRTFYFDNTNILDDKTKKLVSQKNEQYKTTKQQPQVIVAAIKSTGGEDIDSYAPDLFEKWRIGQKDEDNGILILYAVNQGRRNARIEVGYGLEGAVTDAQAGQILTANAKDLKSSDPTRINRGLQQTFNAVTTLIDREYGFKGDKNSLTDKELNEIEHPNRVGLPSAIIIGFVIFALIAFFTGGRGGGHGGSGYGSGGFPWWLLLGSSGGRRYFDDDGDDDDDDYWGGFGSGGFGGGGGFSGGGGSSGGGGASI